MRESRFTAADLEERGLETFADVEATFCLAPFMEMFRDSDGHTARVALIEAHDGRDRLSELRTVFDGRLSGIYSHSFILYLLFV